jgi:hypothetical protein
MAISLSVMSTPPEDSDDTLVARLAAGDEDALRELMSRHARLVFSVAYRHLGGREDAEDVVQDAFTRVLKAAPRYRRDGPFRTYLLNDRDAAVPEPTGASTFATRGTTRSDERGLETRRGGCAEP